MADQLHEELVTELICVTHFSGWQI